MKIKHVLFPLWATLQLCVSTGTARQPVQHTKSNLAFIENKGQVTDQYHQPRPDIKYKLSATNGLNIFLGTGMLHYVWARPHVAKEEEPFPDGSAPRHNDLPLPETDFYRIDVELIGANPHARILREEPQSYYERYFQPWVNTTNSNAGVIARSYSKIVYKEVYPNIDWIFYINANGQLEHDFIVHPGGRVENIRLRYSGATALQLLPDGSLAIQSPFGHITEKTPYSYEELGREVSSRFVLKDSVLSFAVNSYTGILTIDPVLEWATYFGGSGNEDVFDLVTDTRGDVYMTGSTVSTGNIATTGAYQFTYGLGNSDAFISKWNKEGQLLWSSYYGGTNIDVAKGLGTDSLGNIYLGGHTNSSTGIATPGSYQDTKNGTTNGYDAFVVKFDSAGLRQWASYFGGTSNDAHTSVTLTTTPSGNIFLAGNTESGNLPVTAGVHQAVKSTGIDVFVSQLDSKGNLVWSTFYGGPGTEHVYSITTDDALNVYLTGWTQSTSGIATAGTHQTVQAGDRDAYVAKFNNKGQLVWGTYFGGTSREEGRSIAVHDKRVVIAGYTASSQDISTPNVYQPAMGGGGMDAYIAAFDTNGRQLWGTYYGGTADDAILSILIDNEGSIYASGNTTSVDGIADSIAIQTGYAGSYDCFVFKLDASIQRIWGTYYGGTGIEDQGFVAKYGSDIYLAGRTNSAAAIATPNTHSVNLSGGNDVFLLRINDCVSPAPLSVISGPASICAGDSSVYVLVSDSLADTYIWQLPDDWGGYSDSNNIVVQIGAIGGIIRVYAQSACGGISDTQSLEVAVWPLPKPQIQEQDGILSATQTYTGYQWYLDGQAIEGADSVLFIPSVNGAYTLRVTDENGCSGQSDTIWIKGLGINNRVVMNGFSIYPNPVHTALYIQSAKTGTLYIRDVAGKVVSDVIQLYPGNNAIDVQALPAGIYILSCTTADVQSIFKLNKQ